MERLVQFLTSVAHRALVFVGLRKEGPLTAQQVFNRVAKHLFKQGERSVKPDGGCMYRGDGGAMCAVGVLIPDDLYDAGMEDQTVDGIWSPELVAVVGPNLDLLNRLQKVHDQIGEGEDADGRKPNWRTTEAMRLALRQVAVQFGLNASILDRLSFKGR